MKTFSIVILLVFLITFSVKASEVSPDQKQGSVIDYTIHPRVNAHAIVLFEPTEDLNLQLPSRVERKITGRVISSIRQVVVMTK